MEKRVWSFFLSILLLFPLYFLVLLHLSCLPPYLFFFPLLCFPFSHCNLMWHSYRWSINATDHQSSIEGPAGGLWGFDRLSTMLPALSARMCACPRMNYVCVHAPSVTPISYSFSASVLVWVQLRQPAHQSVMDLMSVTGPGSIYTYVCVSLWMCV